MRLYPAFLGGLALLAAALPVVEVAKKPEGPTALSIQDRDVIVPQAFVPVPTGITVTNFDDFVVEHSANNLAERAAKGKTTKSKKPKSKKPKSKKPKAKTPKTKKPNTKKTKTKAPKATGVKTPKPTATGVKTTHAPKTTGVKHPKTTQAKSTGTKTPKTTASTAAKPSSTTTAAQCPVEKPSLQKLCGPTSKCGASNKTAKKGGKKSKTTRALEFVAGIGRSIQEIPDHVTRIFKRVDSFHLDPSEIKNARVQGNKARTEAKSGTYRLLHHGSPDSKPTTPEGQAKLISRMPNDAIFDKFAGSAFFRNFDGLRGCTGVMVASPKGIYSAHLWEKILKADGGVAKVTRNLKKGDRNKHVYIGKSKIDEMWDVRAQLGLLDFGIGKVVTDAWSSPADIHVAVLTPGGTGAYGSIVTEIVNAIKSAIPNIPAANIKIAQYSAANTDAAVGAGSGTKGTMTAYYDGKGKLGIYGEENQILTMSFTPGTDDDNGDHQDGDDSDGEAPAAACPKGQKKKNGMCVVMR